MSKLPPTFPHSSGRFPKQAHVNVPEGTFEEEHGRGGFFGKVSHLYHSNAPTGWSRIEGPLSPHAYDLNKVDASEAPKKFLENKDVALWMYTPKKEMPTYMRNADGDDCWFIHKGEGLVETDFGPLKYRKGDYVILPRGTTYRFFPSGKENFYLLIEAASEYELPDRGQLGRQAFFDPGVLEIPQAQPSKTGPTGKGPDGKPEWEIKIKREGAYTSFFYPYNPLDIVGWKGDLFAWKLNVEDIRPIVSARFHLPPSVHTTVVAKNFVICTFAPRPMETGDPKAQRVPFFHRNIDYDEVIFYHEGDFFSRENIGPAMVTWHPQGFHHGPHPKALANQFTKEFADEYAVMIDTVNPLKAVDAAGSCEVADYRYSWKAK